MNCYLCDHQGYATAAVAICKDCGAALCREHLDEGLLAPRPTGMTRAPCSHSPLRLAQIRRDEIKRLAAAFE